MEIAGFRISDEALEAARARMKDGPFRAADIEAAIAAVVGESAARAGVQRHGELPMRAADRLIQAERKAGRITLGGKPRRWSWVWS